MAKFFRSGNLFFLALFFWPASQAAGQRLYFLSAVNTDNYYRPDRVADAENINKIAGNISKYLNMEKYTYDFGDSINYNPETVKLTLKSLPVIPCSNDIVWFHYSGSGGNYGDGEGPVMRLFGGDLEVKEVERILAAKNPKLLLITIDAGNKTLPNETISDNDQYRPVKKRPEPLKPRVSFISSEGIIHYQVLENYDALFRSFEGARTITIVSSSKGEDAYSDKHKGSYWVQAFDKSFGEIVNGKTGKDAWKETIYPRLNNHLGKLSKNMQHSRIYVSSHLKCEEE